MKKAVNLVFVIPLSIAIAAGYQIYENSQIQNTVKAATVTGVVQQCEKNQCHTVVITDKGTFIVEYGIGAISYEDYISIVGQLAKGSVVSFESSGKEGHFAYVSFFKKQFPHITKIIN